MSYEEFINKMFDIIVNYYRRDARVEIIETPKTNGEKMYGLLIDIKDVNTNNKPIIYFEQWYELYLKGFSIYECVGIIVDNLNDYKCYRHISDFARRLSDWSNVKNDVYPILISPEKTVKGTITKNFIDIFIAYIIRYEVEGEIVASMEITYNMLELYGISIEKLHETAMNNLYGENYIFIDMTAFLQSFMDKEKFDIESILGLGQIYILKNDVNFYGAAGILNKNLLRQKFPDKNCFILPSSVHETIFVIDDGQKKQSKIDKIVEKVNKDSLESYQSLSYHSYYYDAHTGEII